MTLIGYTFKRWNDMTSSSTSSSATASRYPSFESRVQDVKLSKSLINSLVMDYLVSEGYPDSAQNFATEANIQPGSNPESIEERVEIRNLIRAGDIQAAIERINELNPQILDRDSSLHFALLRLQLVELIRACTSIPSGDITPALDFATTQLAPRASVSPEFLRDLEQTMALLIFERNNLAPPLAAIIDPQLRKDVAKRVNEAILRSNGERNRSRLHELVMTRFWAERQARDAKKTDLPDRIELGLDCERRAQSNGHVVDGGGGGGGGGGGSGEGEDSAMQGTLDVEDIAAAAAAMVATSGPLIP